ncbi:hypothetical protein ANN_09453 [Periplaneta americana]|uniref:Uncharacterized protein n=1 Tax=Periplaneta americana TaxID=6978 RepID=A0ABQ8TLD2_PERAM|nr:hypothetical protein ANN_09453 [Periplaneta americana]
MIVIEPSSSFVPISLQSDVIIVIIEIRNTLDAFLLCWYLDGRGIPTLLEPRSDGKRPDGLTLIPGFKAIDSHLSPLGVPTYTRQNRQQRHHCFSVIVPCASYTVLSYTGNKCSLTGFLLKDTRQKRWRWLYTSHVLTYCEPYIRNESRSLYADE